MANTEKEKVTGGNTSVALAQALATAQIAHWGRLKEAMDGIRWNLGLPEADASDWHKWHEWGARVTWLWPLIEALRSHIPEHPVWAHIDMRMSLAQALRKWSESLRLDAQEAVNAQTSDSRLQDLLCESIFRIVGRSIIRGVDTQSDAARLVQSVYGTTNGEAEFVAATAERLLHKLGDPGGQVVYQGLRDNQKELATCAETIEFWDGFPGSCSLCPIQEK